jgi:hypothetical protein
MSLLWNLFNATILRYLFVERNYPVCFLLLWFIFALAAECLLDLKMWLRIGV